MDSINKYLIPQTEIKDAILLFKENDKMPSATRLSKFFLASKPFDRVNLSSNVFYGKYKGQFIEKELTKDIEHFLRTNNINKKERPWDNITFFDEPAFNKHTYQTVEAIKAEIATIVLVKTADLPANIIQARETHPRAYEDWSEKESKILLSAFSKTNDLILLSKWFQRGQKAIKTQGKKLIYQNQQPLS